MIKKIGPSLNPHSTCGRDFQGSISFCHGQALGIAAGAPGAAGAAGYPKKAGAGEQSGGDLGDLLFKEAAEQTRHGILILQLTIDYLWPCAQRLAVGERSRGRQQKKGKETENPWLQFPAAAPASLSLRLSSEERAPGATGPSHPDRDMAKKGQGSKTATKLKSLRTPQHEQNPRWRGADSLNRRRPRRLREATASMDARAHTHAEQTAWHAAADVL